MASLPQQLPLLKTAPAAACCAVLSAPLPPPNTLPPGIPLELIKPEALGAKVFEPLLLLGKQRWGFLDIRLRVKGGGHVSQVYGE